MEGECKICARAEHSYDGDPFVPPSGSVNDGTYACQCGRRWWQHNNFYHLWSEVEDEDTWRNVSTGCHEAVAIGHPSVNVSKLFDARRGAAVDDAVPRREWSSMSRSKPIDPAEYGGIDYGYIVRVKDGPHKGVEGIAVMFSRFGDIGVKTEFPEEPCFLNGYNFRKQSGDLEIVARGPMTKPEWENFKKRRERRE